ncbi:MAG: BatD family protein, partial [Muribaculaceae bacterium]|nr:BatD family protein [Muribaculaceae bacterium]
MKLRHILLVSLLLISGLTTFASSVHLSVQSARGRREIGVGDLFYISYEVADIDAEPERPANVPGAKVMYFERTGQSSRFSSINGKTSQSVSYTYTLTLRAQSEGQFSFGPVSVGGVKSNAVNYTIGAAATP